MTELTNEFPLTCWITPNQKVSVMLTRQARPSSDHALPSAIHSRTARRKSPILRSGKRWQALAASTGIGKVMTGTTLTNKETDVKIKIQTRTKHIHNTAITPEVQTRAFGVSQYEQHFINCRIRMTWLPVHRSVHIPLCQFRFQYGGLSVLPVHRSRLRH